MFCLYTVAFALKKYVFTDLLDADIFIIAIAIIVMMINQSLSFWLMKINEIKILSFSRFIQAGAIILFQILFHLIYTLNDFGLQFGFILGSLMAVCFVCTSLWRKNRLPRLSRDPVTILRSAGQYIDFPRKSLPAAALNAASTQLPVILFGKLFGNVFVGHYNLATRVLNVPMSAIGQAVGQIYLQQTAINKDNPAAISDVTILIYKRMLLLGAIPTLIVALAGPQLFSTILGSEWFDAGVYAQILSPWFLIVFVASPLTGILTSLELHNENLSFNIFLFISRIATILIGFWLFNNNYLTLISFSAIGFLFWIVYVDFLLRSAELNRRSYIRYTLVVLGGTLIVSMISILANRSYM